MAQERAEALLAKLQRGIDSEVDAKAFLDTRAVVPDGLVISSLGNRASQLPSCPKVLKLLLEGRADPNANDPVTQGSALHSACWHGSVDVVRLLLDFRADIERKDPRMQTPPLNTALAAGNAKACLELLTRNADVQWRHHDGATALHVATAWIASSHNAQLRLPPVGDEPRALIAAMLHNGVDPTQTEGMSKGANRSEGMTPLETFRREVARSPWRTHEELGPKFDKTARTIHVLLEQGEQATKLKNIGNKAFSEKRFDDALKQWAEARSIWEKAEVGGHHQAVLWSNEAVCRKNMGDLAGSRKACEEGLKHYASQKIREKLELNLTESSKPPPEPTEEEKAKKAAELEARKEKAKEKHVKAKEEAKEICKKVVESKGGVYGEDGSAQKDYVMPGPFICPMEEAQNMGLGPPKTKTWWEKRDADSDEEERTTIGYLPAHHPNF